MSPPDANDQAAEGASDKQAAEQDFAALTGSFDNPMVIVTVAHDGARSGCLVGFHSQASIDPPLYTVWLSKVNHTYAVAGEAEVLAVHFLGPGQQGLAELFGSTTGDEVDKFAMVAWEPGPGGVPLLAGCPTRLIGRRRTTLEVGGDHACFVLEPIATDGTAPEPALGMQAVIGIDPGHAVG